MKRSRANFEEDGVQEYLKAVAGYTVMTREEEVALFQAYESGDESARDEIVSRNLRFVIKIALQYRGFGVNIADLIQEGNIGLLHVIDKFDWRKGFRFSTYAAYYIRQEIQAAIHRQGNMIRLPVRKARLLGKVQEVCRKYLEREGREPSPEEIASELGQPIEKIRPVMELRHSFVSMDAERGEEGMRLRDALPAEIPAPSTRIEEKQTKAAVYDLLDFLTERERQVVQLRFGMSKDGREYSLRGASKVVGLSQEGVRRVEHRALAKLQRPALRARVDNLLTA